MNRSPYLLTALVLVSCPVPSRGQPVEWAEAEGGNGHFYEAVLATDGITWEPADAAAIAAGGHLVTITSAEENDFVFNLVSDNPDFWWSLGGTFGQGPWLGGFQPPGSPEPSGNWQWVTGEPFIYANWAPSEPNNNVPGSDYLHLFGYHTLIGDQWNDTPQWEMLGYIVEWAGPPSIPSLMMREPWVEDDDVHTGPRGVDSLLLLWSEPVLFDNSDLTINNEDAEAVPFSVSGSNSQFMDIAFGQVLLNDKYTITISDSVVSAETGAPIDGDKDGTGGGDAVLVMEHRNPFDHDHDGDVDLYDFAAFQAVFTGP